MDPAATAAVASAPASFSSYATELECWEPQLAPGHAKKELDRTVLGPISSAALEGEREFKPVIRALLDALAVAPQRLVRHVSAKLGSCSAIWFLDG